MGGLNSILVQEQILSVTQVEKVLQRQVIFGGDFSTNVLEQRLLAEDVLVKYQARVLGIEALLSGQFASVTPKNSELLDATLAVEYSVVPVLNDGEVLVLACTGALPSEAIQQITAAVGRQVALALVLEFRLALLMNICYGTPIPSRMSAVAKKVDPAALGRAETVALEREAAMIALAESEASAEVSPEEMVVIESTRDRLESKESTTQIYKDSRSEPTASQRLFAGPEAAAPLKVQLISYSDACTRLEEVKSRDEIIDLFFDFAHQAFEFSLLCVVQGEEANGKLARIRGKESWNAEHVAVPLDKGGLFEQAMNSRKYQIGSMDTPVNVEILNRLGRDVPLTGAVVPVLLKKRVVLLLYGDSAHRGVKEKRVAKISEFTQKVAAAFERILRQQKYAAYKKRSMSAAPAAPAVAGTSAVAEPGHGADVRGVQAETPPFGASDTSQQSSGASGSAGGAVDNVVTPVSGAPGGSNAAAESGGNLAPTPVEAAPVSVAPLPAPECKTDEEKQAERKAIQIKPANIITKPPRKDFSGWAKPVNVESIPPAPMPSAAPEASVDNSHGADGARETISGISARQLAAVNANSTTVDKTPSVASSSAAVDDAVDTSPVNRAQSDASAGVYIQVSKKKNGASDGGAASNDDVKAVDAKPIRFTSSRKKTAPHKVVPDNALAEEPILLDNASPRETAAFVAVTPEQIDARRRAEGTHIDDDDEPGHPILLQSETQEFGSGLDEAQMLVHDLMRNEAGDDAIGKLKRYGERAIGLLITHFPGPLLCDRYKDLMQYPHVGEHGPVLKAFTAFDRQSIRYVLPLLGSFDSEIRFYSVFLLSEVGGAEVLEYLTKMVFDNDRQIRSMVIKKIREWEQTPEHAQAINDIAGVLTGNASSLDKKRIAADVLGLIRNPAVVPDLIRMLGSVDRKLSEKCRDSLVRITFADFGYKERQWSEWFRTNRSKDRFSWALGGLDHPSADVLNMAIDELRHMTDGNVDFPISPLNFRQRKMLQKKLMDWRKDNAI